MFASTLNLDTIIPRVQSKQINTIRGTINIDFSSGTNDTHKKRSSFLPVWLENEHIVATDDYANLGSSVFHPTKDTMSSKRLVKEFCTGSHYIGGFNKLGMSGRGIYKYPHGVVYDGFFNKQGEFHGSGTLIYPNGQRVEGFWKNGKLSKGASCVTVDNIPFASQYCKPPDRRFQIEVQYDLAPAGQEYLTNAPNPPRPIPKGCYDTGEGYYDPVKRIIYDYKDSKITRTLNEFMTEREKEILDLMNTRTAHQSQVINKLRQWKFSKYTVSIPPEMKEEWILKRCRKERDEAVGYCVDLYETWTTGRRAEQIILMQVDDTAADDDDNFIKSLSKLTHHDSAETSTLFSFIPSSGSQVCQRSSNEILKSGSLTALSKMFLPSTQGSDYFKYQVLKKAHIYHAKMKSYKRRKPSKTFKHNDSRHLHKLKQME